MSAGTSSLYPRKSIHQRGHAIQNSLVLPLINCLLKPIFPPLHSMHHARESSMPRSSSHPAMNSLHENRSLLLDFQNEVTDETTESNISIINVRSLLHLELGILNKIDKIISFPLLFSRNWSSYKRRESRVTLATPSPHLREINFEF